MYAGWRWTNRFSKVLVHFEGWWPEWDGNGDVSSAVSDCIEGLAVCLEKVEDAKTRQPWLEVLLAAYFEDVRQGGIDYLGSADGHLLEQATDEEWRWIDKEVREEIDRRENWGRTTLVGFLTARLEMTGQEKEADDFVLAHGTAEQRAYLLLNRGRIEEAIEVARQHFAGRPGLVIDFANRLEDAGHAETARGYMAEQVDDPYGSHYRLWLAAHYEEHGDLEAALALRQHQFEKEPRHEIYLTLQRLGQQTGVWEQLRPSLLARLDPHRHASLLITIALDEGDVARALDLVSQPRVYCDPGTLVRVAQAAEVEHPLAALKIYYDQAERAIAGRSRAAYAVAAERLARVRDLHRQLGEESLWQEYIARLRNEHRRLRALKEELDRAGL
ncbi:MAG: hypothetical protein JXA93_01070 [Anaerolineae bacterium]|nr:hypothetical protein [Anaerolineae bacterium]